MIPIESIPPPLTPEDRARKQHDRLVLTAEERRWPRGRFRTESGRELAFALPSGAQFEPGQTVSAGEDWFVAIEAAAEPVLAVYPASEREAVRIAFEVGNRHFPLGIDGEGLLVPDDPAMTQLFDRLGVAWRREKRAFEPIGKTHRHEH